MTASAIKTRQNFLLVYCASLDRNIFGTKYWLYGYKSAGLVKLAKEKHGMQTKWTDHKTHERGTISVIVASSCLAKDSFIFW